MRVSGFTFLRNAVINGYPFVESIQSILPLVDEFICAIGPCEDETREMVADIGDERIRILDTAWNENMTDRGFVYGQQKMIAQYCCNGDWAFYLEGDEVLHEEEIETIRRSMELALPDSKIEALYFNFHHFYGTPQQVGISGYRRAPRIIRNSVRTIAPDGLFWVVLDENKRGRYPYAKDTGANIYHYGHCRSISKMNNKLQRISKYWSVAPKSFEGYGAIDKSELREFRGTHPKIMERWILNEAEHTFEPSLDYKISSRDIRNRIRFWLEEKLNLEISKKHYKSVK